MGNPHAADVAGEPTLEGWISRLVKAPLAHQPGAGWTYGFSIDVLGRLIEVISGKPFDAFLKERLFGPLGMPDTDFYAPPEKHSRLAKVYGMRPEGGLERVEWSTNGYHRKPGFLSGGGGLVSTAADYLRFAQMLLNGGELDGERVLGRRTVRAMGQNHASRLPYPVFPAEWRRHLGCAMGLGVRTVADEAAVGINGSLGTIGWSGLATTDFWVDPQEELIGLFLAQMIPGPGAVHDQCMTLVYQALV